MLDLVKSLDKEKIINWVFPSVNDQMERDSVSVYFEIPSHKAIEMKHDIYDKDISNYISDIYPTLVSLVKKYIPNFKYSTAHFAEIPTPNYFRDDNETCYLVADENYENVVAMTFSFVYDDEIFSDPHGGLGMEVLKVF